MDGSWLMFTAGKFWPFAGKKKNELRGNLCDSAINRVELNDHHKIPGMGLRGCGVQRVCAGMKLIYGYKPCGRAIHLLPRQAPFERRFETPLRKRVKWMQVNLPSSVSAIGEGEGAGCGIQGSDWIGPDSHGIPRPAALHCRLISYWSLRWKVRSAHQVFCTTTSGCSHYVCYSSVFGRPRVALDFSSLDKAF